MYTPTMLLAILPELLILVLGVALLTVEPFWIGAPVEVQSSADDEWYPGRVLERWESLHFCHYDDYGPEYDEWFGPSRIRHKAK